MAAKKNGKSMRAGERAPERKLKKIRRNSGEGIGKRRNTRASTLATLTSATAKHTEDRLDRASSTTQVVKQGEGDEKPRRSGKLTLVAKVLKDDRVSPQEKSRIQAACKRSRGRNGANGNEDLGMEETCSASATGSHWTEQQEKAFEESLAAVKPGVNFWHLIAERVPGRSAEDCFKKFYSGRTTTRAAKRSRTEEADSALIERNLSPYVGFLHSNRSGLVRKEIQTCSKVPNARACTRQTTSTVAYQGTRSRIDGARRLPEIEQVTAKKRDEIQTASHNAKAAQRALKGSKSKAGRQDLVGKPENQVGGGTQDVTFSEDGEEEFVCPSDSLDEDLWTTAQETALQDAYATTKPSADFWHLISKRVPHRSAEECFNKFYSAHPTPPRAVPAQRPCKKEVDFLPSVSNDPQPPRPRRAKRLLEARKIVRDILRRQQVDDKDYEADAFAALEPPDVVDSVIETTKDDGQCGQSGKESPKPKAVGGQRSELEITQSSVFSPEILKKVKNPLMLDKYIDHFHQRRTRKPGTKSAQNISRARGVNDNHSKYGLDFREMRLDVIHRAKQGLRDVFLRPGSAVDEPILDLLSDSADEHDGDEEDDESVES